MFADYLLYLIKSMRQRYRGKKLVIILDGLNAHKSQ